jgi:hypothetical protein
MRFSDSFIITSSLPDCPRKVNLLRFLLTQNSHGKKEGCARYTRKLPFVEPDTQSGLTHPQNPEIMSFRVLESRGVVANLFLAVPNTPRFPNDVSLKTNPSPA